VASPEGAGSGSSVAAVLCERKYVYSQTQRSCVEANSALISDEERYAQGRALALAGHYTQALDALESVTRSDAPVLTMIGYAKRKLGRFDEGIAAYREALAIDPNSAEAREYLGEAYVETDRFDLARIELDRIAAICGNQTCEQYVDLAEAITNASP
jgi:Flp pilus assembly protein TadD